MDRILWKGTSKNFIAWFKERNKTELFKAVRDNFHRVAVLTTKDSCQEELSRTLNYGILQLDEFKENIIDADTESEMIFEAGRLYGALLLSSHVCYEKKKDMQVYETALSVCGIRHFDEIIALIEKRRELTQTQLCDELDMPASTLSDCMKKILKTNLISCRKSGKYKAYSLSDDGIRYVRIHRQEVSRENKKWASFVESQFQNMVISSLSALDKNNDELYEMTKNEGKYSDNIEGYKNGTVFDKTGKDNKLEITSTRLKELQYA